MVTHRLSPCLARCGLGLCVNSSEQRQLRTRVMCAALWSRKVHEMFVNQLPGAADPACPSATVNRGLSQAQHKYARAHCLPRRHSAAVFQHNCLCMNSDMHSRTPNDNEAADVSCFQSAAGSGPCSVHTSSKRCKQVRNTTTGATMTAAHGSRAGLTRSKHSLMRCCQKD